MILTMSAIEKLLSQRPSAILYHYTSPAGLLGIVKSRSLWASGIHYLNDSSEYRHAVGVLQDCARRPLMAIRGKIPFSSFSILSELL